MYTVFATSSPSVFCLLDAFSSFRFASERVAIDPEGDNYDTINCHTMARAALFSLNYKPKPPTFMIHKTLTIGSGPNCDLVLSNYGNCSFTSSKHAIIFFDEVMIHRNE